MLTHIPDQTVTNDANQIAAELKARRKQLGLTQRDLAGLAGVSLRFVHDLESGKPSVQLTKLLDVANALGLEFALQMRRAIGR